MKTHIFLAGLRISIQSYHHISIHFLHVLSSGGKLQLPDEYLALDGNSLATDDLLQLGKGMYKVGTTWDVAVGVQNIEIK